jgi:23S rRNA-/tRNA-specific pseudouridylate synthase
MISARQLGVKTRAFASSLSDNYQVTIDTLPNFLEEAYSNGETDGVIRIAPSIYGKFSADDIVSASLQATKNNKGQAAGILNAVIGSCSLHKSNSDASLLAWNLYCTWEAISDEMEFSPDIVTFCNTFSVLNAASEYPGDDQDFYKACAAQVLDRAQRYSKKLGGSKRRKLLNTLSRRPSKNHTAIQQIDALKKFSDDLEILFENDDLIVINKPSGMVLFHSKTTTNGKISRKKLKHFSDAQKGEDNHFDLSLVDILLELGIQLSTLNNEALGVVHRIDRGTSGAIVLAKTDEMHCKLVTAFFTRSVDKNYVALVPWKSCIDESNQIDQGQVDLEVGGRPALSTYKVIKRYPDNKALQLLVQTQTGRKHQVRVHCAKGLGRPIFLDTLYDDRTEKVFIHEKLSNPGKSLENKFFLHASSLRIDEFGIDVTANIPNWWHDILNEIE